MSIQSEITRISGNVINAFTAIANKGVSIPSGSNSDDLATLIGQIPQDITMGAVSVVDAPDSEGGTVRTIIGVDISSDTVTAAHLETGYTAHDAEGNPIVGVLSPGNVTVESMSISLNGTYTAPSGKAYSPVIVNVPASAVDSGTKSITSNGSNQDVVGYAAVDVSVPNSYSVGDEGKVVSNGALVSQTAHAEVTQNGTIDTTLNNSVVVNVPNSYAAGDEGKVVSNGALVAQSSDTATQNGTVDTTLINSLTVNVSGGGDDMLTWSQLATVDCSQNNGNIELTNLDNYTAFYISASAVHNDSTTASAYSLQINNTAVFDNGPIAIAKTGTTQYQNFYAKYNGLFWELYSTGTTTNNGYKRASNLQGAYTYVLNVGKATSIKLVSPMSQYQATSGTITIYGGK